MDFLQTKGNVWTMDGGVKGKPPFSWSCARERGFPSKRRNFRHKKSSLWSIERPV